MYRELIKEARTIYQEFLEKKQEAGSLCELIKNIEIETREVDYVPPFRWSPFTVGTEMSLQASTQMTPLYGLGKTTLVDQTKVRRSELENFRSLHDVTLSLKPLRNPMWGSLYANGKNLDFVARP